MGAHITYRTNGSTTPAHLALPSSPGPGVIVIQEWWGLNPQIEGVVDRFAAAGFVAMAPDLYHGTQTKSPDQAAKLMMSMRIDEASRDLSAAIRHVAALPECRGGVGTVGFCMGGALSLYAACQNSEVGACVVFYGGHPNVKPDLNALRAPVLGLYGGKDTSVSPAVVGELDAALNALDKRHEFHTYPQAGHAFFNEQRPEAYNAAAAEDAWNRTLAFFRRELNASGRSGVPER